MTRRILIAIALLVALVPSSGAFAAPDHTKTLAVGESFDFQESLPAGTNINYFPWAPQAEAVLPVGQCSKNPHYYCDTLLVKFVNPMTAEEIAAGLTQKKRAANISIGNYGFPQSDFDLRAFASDEAGTKGPMIGESGNEPGAAESITLNLVSKPTIGEHWVLFEVGYWAGLGGYDGKVKF